LEDGPAAERSTELYILLTTTTMMMMAVVVVLVITTRKHDAKELQKTAILGIAYILPKVLMQKYVHGKQHYMYHKS
jgi:hypothetical protein